MSRTGFPVFCFYSPNSRRGRRRAFKKNQSVHTNSIFALEGDCSVIREQPVDRTTYSTPESGYQTIAGGFYHDGALHDQLPEESTFSMAVSALPVTDLDGDGAAEAAAAIKIRPEPVQDSNPNIEPIWGFAEWGTVGESWSGGTMIVNAATGEREYIYHICQLVEAGLAVGTVKPDKPGPALFVLNDSDSIAGFHMTDPHGFAGAGNLIGAFGKNQRLHSGSYHQPNILHEVPQFEDTLYFRTTFTIENTADIREWVASDSASEGSPLGIAALYFNGTWIPTQDPGLSDGAGNSVQMLDLSPFISALNDGENTPAVRYDNEYQV